MLNRHQQYGKASEQAAAAHLKQQGYKIISRNYRTPLGEIDIIARQGSKIVFVEVKARKTNRFGSARESITREKQGKLTRAALCYLKETGQYGLPARFDIVLIQGEAGTPEVIPNAFEAVWPG